MGDEVMTFADEKKEEVFISFYLTLCIDVKMVVGVESI